MGSTPLGGCKGYFLKFLFSNFRSHIKGSKWGRKCIFMNYTCCNGSPQKSHFSLQIGNCPIPVAEHSGHSHLLDIWTHQTHWTLWTNFTLLHTRNISHIGHIEHTRDIWLIGHTWSIGVIGHFRHIWHIGHIVTKRNGTLCDKDILEIVIMTLDLMSLWHCTICQ